MRYFILPFIGLLFLACTPSLTEEDVRRIAEEYADTRSSCGYADARAATARGPAAGCRPAYSNADVASLSKRASHP